MRVDRDSVISEIWRDYCMENIKYKVILKEILEMTKKADLIEELASVKDQVFSKNVEISTLLKDVNIGNLSLFEPVTIKGFLLDSSSLIEPITYTAQRAEVNKITFKKGIRGSYQKDTEYKAARMNPPIIRQLEEKDEKVMAYLYLSENPFEFKFDENHSIVVENNNKFIPVLMNRKEYYTYRNLEVAIICEIVPLQQKIIDMIYSNASRAHQQIIEGFIDYRSPDIKGIVLNAIKCDKISEIKANRLVNYCAEYRIANENTPASFIADRIDRAISSFDKTFTKDSYLCINNEIKQYLLNGKIKVNYYDRNIGFYISTDLNDYEEHLKNMNKLHEFIKEFSDKMRIKWNLEFLSDLRDIEYFNL